METLQLQACTSKVWLETSRFARYLLASVTWLIKMEGINAITLFLLFLQYCFNPQSARTMKKRKILIKKIGTVGNL